MHVASEPALRPGRQHGGRALLPLIVLALVLVLAFAGAAWVVDLLQPEPEIVTMAPFRW